MSKTSYRHLFGPVPSRRFGRSLGIDLTPFKTCSFDCIFCQLGRTTNKTAIAAEYVPAQKVLTELADWLKNDGAADFISLAGSGEPTLNSFFGQIIDVVHRECKIPVALLTNGTQLIHDDVRLQAAKADVIKLSLSAWDQQSLDVMNRPVDGVKFSELIKGMQDLRQICNNQIWLEVFLAWGINTAPDDVRKIAQLAASIAPDKIQLNTAVRPPCEDFARPVPKEQLLRLAELFQPKADPIAEFSSDHSSQVQATEADVLVTLQRRPCTLGQLCAVFGLHRNEASKYIGKLLRTGQIVEQRKASEWYYTGVHQAKS